MATQIQSPMNYEQERNILRNETSDLVNEVGTLRLLLIDSREMLWKLRDVTFWAGTIGLHSREELDKMLARIDDQLRRPRG